MTSIVLYTNSLRAYELPTPSVTLPVTASAKRYQVVCHIVTEPTPGLHVMDLQAFQPIRG